MPGHRILIVDDEVSFLDSMRRGLRSEPYELLLAKSGEEALEIIRDNWVSVVISDYMMPDMNGLELMRTIWQNYPGKLMIMLTAISEIDIAVQAINQFGVYKFFLKPLDLNEFRMTIRTALEMLDMRGKKESLVRKLHTKDSIVDDLNTRFPGVLHVKTDEDGYYIPEV
jgi:DNA-binding NtrC family response regulator